MEKDTLRCCPCCGTPMRDGGTDRLPDEIRLLIRLCGSHISRVKHWECPKCRFGRVYVPAEN